MHVRPSMRHIATLIDPFKIIRAFVPLFAIVHSAIPSVRFYFLLVYVVLRQRMKPQVQRFSFEFREMSSPQKRWICVNGRADLILLLNTPEQSNPSC